MKRNLTRSSATKVSFNPKKLTPLFAMLLLFLGTSVNSIAQSNCDHISIEQYSNVDYFGFGIKNNSSEITEWELFIPGANYKLDPDNFENEEGFSLEVNTIDNGDGTFNHELISSDPIPPYSVISFAYFGEDESYAKYESEEWEVTCMINVLNICPQITFNTFQEQRYSWGFIVQNNSSITTTDFEVYISNANYRLTEADLYNPEGNYDFTSIDNGDGTYDYIFVNTVPVPPYSSAGTVKAAIADFGFDTKSESHLINCELSNVSSGNTGGLESHGGLASKIALRNFKKSVGINTTPPYKVDNSIVSAFAPEHILSGDQRVESSPTDLIAVTAAKTIWAGDYYIGENRYASVFGSKTENEVYDHTKVICDRVKGSELLQVEVINISGFDAIINTIKRPNNEIEHAVSFSLAYTNFGEFEFMSNWAIEDYEKRPNFLNYQVWTNNKGKTVKAVQNILTEIVEGQGNTLTASNKPSVAPDLFAKSAKYRLGAFHLELHNTLSTATMIDVSGKIVSKEVGGEIIPFSQAVQLQPGQKSLKIDIPYGNIFDGEISIEAAGNSQKDVIYLADGAWGLEYNESATTLSTFDILADDRTETSDEYLVERGIAVAGTTDSYLSIFKQLAPGGLPVDLTAYNAISFNSVSSGTYEVSLLTSGNTDPSKNLTHTLEVDGNSEVTIPFTFFTNADNGVLDASDVTTIYIAYQAAHNENGEFAMEIEKVRFKNLGLDLEITAGNLEVYPNPTVSTTRLTHFFKSKTEALVTVYNTNGQVIESFTQTAYKGYQNIDIPFKNAEPGVYLISLQTDEGIFSNSVILTL